jgi:hypothetical protein
VDGTLNPKEDWRRDVMTTSEALRRERRTGYSEKGKEERV